MYYQGSNWHHGLVVHGRSPSETLDVGARPADMLLGVRVDGAVGPGEGEGSREELHEPPERAASGEVDVRRLHPLLWRLHHALLARPAAHCRRRKRNVAHADRRSPLCSALLVGRT